MLFLFLFFDFCKLYLKPYSLSVFDLLEIFLTITLGFPGVPITITLTFPFDVTPESLYTLFTITFNLFSFRDYPSTLTKRCDSRHHRNFYPLCGLLSVELLNLFKGLSNSFEKREHILFYPLSTRFLTWQFIFLRSWKGRKDLELKVSSDFYSRSHLNIPEKKKKISWSICRVPDGKSWKETESSGLFLRIPRFLEFRIEECLRQEICDTEYS